MLVEDDQTVFDSFLKLVKRRWREQPEPVIHLVDALEALTDSERLELLMVVQVGRGNLKIQKSEDARWYLSSPDVTPGEVPSYLIQLWELDDYILDGLQAISQFVDSSDHG